MCYEIVTSDKVCFRNHPFPDHSILWHRMCQAHAEDCRNGLRALDTTCNRDIVPHRVWERIRNCCSSGPCLACEEIKGDPEMAQIHSEDQQLKYQIAAKGRRIIVHREALAGTELQGLVSDDPRSPLWTAIGKLLEARVDALLKEISFLQSGKAKEIDDRFYNRRREVEQKHEETILEAAQKKALIDGIDYYYGSVRKRERYQIPNDYPKHFSPFEKKYVPFDKRGDSDADSPGASSGL